MDLPVCLHKPTKTFKKRAVHTQQGMDDLAGTDPCSYCTQQRLLLAWGQQSLTPGLGRPPCQLQLLHSQKLCLCCLAASFLVPILTALAKDQHCGHHATGSEVGL